MGQSGIRRFSDIVGPASAQNGPCQMISALRMMDVRNFEDEPYAFCDLCGGSPSAVERFGVGWWFRCGSCGMSTIIPALHDPSKVVGRRGQASRARASMDEL